jgi:cob(I)alamin adenosyltransferase
VVKIYTRKGDDGTTSLWYGGRVAKTDVRTEAYGSIDEANSALGTARALCKAHDQADLHATILSLQHGLFVAGAELATSPEAADRLQDEEIDRYMSQVDLPPHFVIPGGTQLSAALDVARSVMRRAERRTVELRDSKGLASDMVLRYLNRASDLAFALARFADDPDPEMFEGRSGA